MEKKKRLGLTGILRPNGEYIPCSYGNHGKITKQIPEEEGTECIYFSSYINKEGNQISLLYLNNILTKPQLIWIMKNINKLDEIQYKEWIKYLKNKGSNL